MVGVCRDMERIRGVSCAILSLRVAKLTPGESGMVRVKTIHMQGKRVTSACKALIHPKISVPRAMMRLAKVASRVTTLKGRRGITVRRLLRFVKSSVLIKRGLVFSCDFLGR